MTFEYLVLPIAVDQRNELVVRMVGLEAEHPFAQAVISTQRLGAGLRRRHEILDDRRWNVVAVKRGVERARELPRLRDEPVALQDAVVDGGVCIRICGKRAVERLECGRAIRLMTIGLEQRVVLAVGQRHLLPVVERDDRMLDVGVREHRVNVVRHIAEAARQRQQQLTLLVEHMLLLVVRALDGKPIRREIGARVHPTTHRRERDAEELRCEPRTRFSGFREENLNLLPARVRGVVTLILIVVQAGVIPDPVGELSEVVAETKSLQQTFRSLCQRAAQLGIARQHAVELAKAGFPFAPAGIDIGKIPGEARRYFVARSRAGIKRGFGCHLSILVDLRITQACRGREQNK